MPPLVLDSLEIENFRTFRHLKIERLGRVNLLVGKNNVGKTSLLEALTVYASGGTLRSVRNLLADRQVILSSSHVWEDMTIKERLDAISHLFRGWPEISLYPDTVPPAIRLSSEPNLPEITLSVGWYKSVYDPNRSSASLTRLLPDEFETITNPIPVLEAQLGSSNEPLLYHLDEADRGFTRIKGFPWPHTFLSTGKLSSFEVRRLWNRSIELGQHETIEPTLRLIEPDIKSVHVLSESRGKQPNSEAIRMIVRLANNPAIIPLQSLGEGVGRLFHIALALPNSQDGLLLIDEIENGFHYSVLPQVWRFIFEQAERLNVQVFATTHSWECIQAFQEAATENEEVEGMLFSLREKQGRAGEIAAVDLDERDMEIATHANIEVR